jgi:hypothetical protein
MKNRVESDMMERQRLDRSSEGDEEEEEEAVGGGSQ